MGLQASRFGAMAIVGLVALASPALGHEFWIEPEDFNLDKNQQIRADIRIGQDFKGDAFPYVPSRFTRFRLDDRAGGRDVEGTTGDSPALKMQPREAGLQILTYVSVADRLTFREWEKFLSYLEYEGLEGVADRHTARGLPQTGFAELYTRCAKALVAVGDASGGEDRATGMRIELIASQNPQTLSPGSEMEFTLLWEGAPLTDTQVGLFKRGQDGAKAVRTITRTDANGIARFPIPADGTYLAAAVHMTEPPPERNAAWESFWASLTFAVE